MSEKNIFKVKTSKDKNKDQEYINELTEKIIKQIKETKVCSINRICRDFEIGFNLCVQIINDLEKRGIVSELDETRERKVLI